MTRKLCRLCLAVLWITNGLLLFSQERRKIIIDQDCRGPATTDLQAVLVLLQSPHVQPLGITVVSGDSWRDEEVAHTVRLLEIAGRTDIPVVPGAVFPLVNNKAEIERWEKVYGKVPYKGAWNEILPGENAPWKLPYHDPFIVPPLREGTPSLRALDEDAAHFLVRMVHKYPHEVTIYAGGPLTDLALALAIDSQFAELTHELVVMGGSLNPGESDPEFAMNPRREFNFWWDPEATHIVLHARWPKITITTVDISIKTRLTKAMIVDISKADTPVAQYLAKYADEEYMWDELAAAAWLEPGIITKEQVSYLDIDISHGAGYGNTISWTDTDRPGLGEQPAHVPVDLDSRRFYDLFVQLMKSPTPRPKSTGH
ncbi:MAG TPA: nucleoside hydrolase [Terriglobales bacterium]|nr:nucleoside hydrolase [Terriglobales bacterium]